MDLTIYGGTGFVGTAYVNKFKDVDSIHIPKRYSRRPDPYKKTDILYLISTTHNKHVYDDPTLDVKTNLVVLTETLDSWRKNNPEGVFNFVSSWFVYGKMIFGSVAEEDECNPEGFYSITKRTAELLLMDYCKTFDLKYRILRLSNVIGPGDNGASKNKNALQYLINEMKANRPITLVGGGEFLRTWIDIEDCVDAIRLVMEKGELNSIYNIGTESRSFVDLIDIARENLPVKYTHATITNDYVYGFILYLSKLYALGYKPKYTLEQSVLRMIEDTK